MHWNCWTNNLEILGVVFIDNPPVSCSPQVISIITRSIPVHLDVEIVQVVLLDGLDGAQHIPVDTARARRGRHRAGLHPPAVGVQGLQQFAVRDHVRVGGRVH